MPSNPPLVLIAEDDPALARVLSFKFKSSGFSTIVATDGQIAWEAFQANPVAAIVSDQGMPRMSGIDLCRQVRSQNPNIPFFLVTARQMELATTKVADELNIQHVFGKPFSPADLIAAVGDAIGKSSAIC